MKYYIISHREDDKGDPLISDAIDLNEAKDLLAEIMDAFTGSIIFPDATSDDFEIVDENEAVAYLL
jgi:hypothetical protein